MIIVVIFINSIMMNIITASLVVQYHHQARLLPLSAPTGPWVLSSLLLRQCIILYTTMIILLSPTYSDCLIFNILDFVFCFHHPVHDHYHLAVSYFENVTIKSWKLLLLRISPKLRRQPEPVRGWSVKPVLSVRTY